MPKILEFRSSRIVPSSSNTAVNLISIPSIGSSYTTLITGTSGLVSYYLLNESSIVSGTTSAVDSKSIQNGIYQGTCTGGQNVPVLVSTTQSVLFNGTTGYVNIPHNVAFDITTAVTLEIWIKYTSNARNGNNTHIFTKSYTANSNPFDCYGLIGEGTGGVFAFTIGKTAGVAPTIISGTTPALAGIWYHVCGVYDGTQMLLYVNGHLEAGISLTGNILTTINPLTIAASYYSSATSFSPTTLSNAALYNVALTLSQIAQHAQYLYPAFNKQNIGNYGILTANTNWYDSSGVVNFSF